MPEYLPRVKNLFTFGFGNLAYLIAIVYNTVRILPDNHIYLRADKVGQYGIRHVIAEAANHISLKKNNIDQIFVFFSIIAALVIFVIQFVLLAMAVFIPKSHAQNLTLGILDEYFKTQTPDQDIAFQLLNLVFGIPEFFGGTGAVTLPLHTALHKLFEFYSYGILMVGILLIIYMVITTIAETAQSGIPFGRRFNKTWTPIRIVLFFALLLPITLGLNSAQYITLFSAKMGSGLATNSWLLYNETIADENAVLLGEREQTVAIPEQEDLMHLPAFMTVVKTCEFAYESYYSPRFSPESWADGILPWLIYQRTVDGGRPQWTSELLTDATTYPDLIERSSTREVILVFGVRDRSLYSQHIESIAPICGTLSLKVTDASQPGAEVIREAYFEIVRDLWNGNGDDDNNNDLFEQLANHSHEFARLTLSIFDPTDVDLPDHEFKERWKDYLTQRMNGVIDDAVTEQVEAGDWDMPPAIKDRGWAAAGIWYNKIAEQNGALISALRVPPVPVLYPRVQETFEKYNLLEETSVNPLQRFSISHAPGTPGNLVNEHEREIGRALNYAFTYWNEKGNGIDPDLAVTSNAFLDMVNIVLGTQGLFELCRNVDVHPLAQLSAVGKSMLENSIKTFAGSAIFSLFGAQPVFLQSTATAFSSFFGTIAGVSLLIGFILFYVLPFMPFIYFFFGVSAWIKTIFEAMVAMPLWALAHLRIDGEGIMGDAAEKGYYLIFEIFIRPVLIVFGLIAAIIVCSTLVKVLNQVFYLVVTNVTGNGAPGNTGCFNGPQADLTPGQVNQQTQINESYRGPIDEFFFTIVYAIIVYMIATSCFKMIDAVPNNILRWITAEVPSFGDNSGDAAEGLMKYVTLGGSQFGEKIGDSVADIGGGIQKSTAGAVHVLGSE